LQELVNCADFIMSCGNDQVILCERGIRSFETNTRFTLDLCGVAWLKQHCNLPVILDPSHAMGYAYGIGDLARACTAMGIDGLLIEMHPCPQCAQSDAPQQLDHQQFGEMYTSLKPIAHAVGKTLV
jgi:3-deoxy-7-phosphoheptulonate synthase